MLILLKISNDITYRKLSALCRQLLDMASKSARLFDQHAMATEEKIWLSFRRNEMSFVDCAGPPSLHLR